MFKKHLDRRREEGISQSGEDYPVLQNTLAGQEAWQEERGRQDQPVFEKMPGYGFNFQWMFLWGPGKRPVGPDARALDFLSEFGFNFVRIPTDYRFWARDFTYFHPDESVWEYIDAYLKACSSRGLHLCLNLHRAPGYCINQNELERYMKQ